ncbi:CGG triplet repeat-binding protein 1 [Rhizophagus clarus]|uniref:CGG triplet repeat-binding protein 1 n=1 Tax=Rhizophagus clarus TaxID=94130 RepID=A0A8H3KX78_9GLOM|nr:CGG triplet repeat-binding protein 1 [Rhizophagus clarus]
MHIIAKMASIGKFANAEYRENYIVQENKLWCRFCNVEIDHERKNSVDKHIKTLKHLNNKNKNNSNLLIQRTLPSFENTLNKRKKINKEIVEAFTYANILLEKIEKLKPFLLNHCKNGTVKPRYTDIAVLGKKHRD